MDAIPDKSPKKFVADFLASTPTHDEIIAFRLPDPFEERHRVLLDKQRKKSITRDELTELHEFVEID